MVIVTLPLASLLLWLGHGSGMYILFCRLHYYNNPWNSRWHPAFADVIIVIYDTRRQKNADASFSFI